MESSHQVEPGRSWLRLQAGASAALSASLLATLAVIGAFVPPLVVFGLLFAFFAYAVWRWGEGRRWVRLVVGIVTLLVLLGNLPFIVEDLVHPESALAFVPAAISVIAGLVAVVAGVAGFFRVSETPARLVGLGSVGLSVVAVVVAAVAGLTLESDTAEAGDLVIVASAVEFPEMAQATAGQALLIENHDRVRHTFAIKSQDIEVELPASVNRRIPLELAAGEYEYVCTVPGHEAMEGTLTIVPE